MTPEETLARMFDWSTVAQAEFVTSLYRAILGREPDPAGLEYWTKEVPLRGRYGVGLAFLTSEEFAIRRVTGAYVDFVMLFKINAGIEGIGGMWIGGTKIP